ncbi:Telomeric repeat-binding factor 2 [Hordeum vulgare]|nr:Telomeric repeat-binding factor 2 [Hordeum vulgare]
MGEPKQKWTAEEEAALKAGTGKHEAKKWCTILKDPEFRNILRYRSNIDLKVRFLGCQTLPALAADKCRNMNVTVNASGSGDKVRMMVTTTSTAKKPRSAPKQESHSTAITTITSNGDDDVVDVKHIIKPIVTFTTRNKSLSRLENIILEAVKTLNEPTRSYKTAVANSSEQYWPPADFDHVLSAKLNELTSSRKLMKAVQHPKEVEQQANIHIHLPPSGWTSPCSEHLAFGINCRVGNAML